MDVILKPVPAAEARAFFAELLLNDQRAPEPLGRVELEPHQRVALSRIEGAMREFGGALLADETGLGKTYVAIAIARSATRPLVVAPAALRDMWREATAAAGAAIPFHSMEALSRGAAAPVTDADLVIVDEAHHARNPATSRYRAQASLTAGAKVLLLSATPLHNSTRDLASLLALFLGARAFTLDAAWTSRCVIRRTSEDVPTGSLPRVGRPQPLRLVHDEAHLEAILALPPPVPPLDGGDGGTLLVYSLLRQWASTQGALMEALRRRLARATALLAGLEAGLHPSAGELAAWSFVDGAVQLAFPELMIATEHCAPDGAGLAVCVRTHAAAVRALLDDLARAIDPDIERAAHLLALRTRHPGEKIVVFSQYAESVNTMFRLMRSHVGVAALTATGGLVAGGALTRAETLGRFAPRAQGAGRVPEAHRIDLLLATDLLSEGVNLQDASVVVHLDLPWTPARLEQRVGRLARMESRHASVAVYAMLPPASSERIVRVEQRLRDKLRLATRLVGVAGTILPSLAFAGDVHPVADDPEPEGRPNACAPPADSRPDESPARLGEAILAVLALWRESAAGLRVGPLVAAVRARANGFVALVGDAGSSRLLADMGAGPSDDPSVLLAALQAAGAADAPVDPRAQSDAMSAIARWLAARRARSELSLDGALRARARRSVARRIAAIARRAPRHLRPAITALAATARQTVSARYGAGAERVLEELAAASMPDEAWLRAVGTFGTLHGTAPDAPDGSATAVQGLILLSGPPAASPETPTETPPSGLS